MEQNRKRVLIKDDVYGDNIQLMLTDDQIRLLHVLQDSYCLISEDAEIIEFDDESAWEIV